MLNVKVYTPDEVAEAMRLTRRTVYALIKSGRLEATWAGRWRISEKQLQDFMATSRPRKEQK